VPVSPLLGGHVSETVTAYATGSFRQAVLTRRIEHARGTVRIPGAPGHGIEINRDALRAFTTQDAA